MKVKKNHNAENTMHKNIRMLLIFVIIFFAIISQQAQSQLPEMVEKSFPFTNHLERYRSLPDTIEVDEQLINAGAFFQMAIQSILQIANHNASNELSSDWFAPDTLYPKITLSQATYGRMIEKEDYLNFFQTLLSKYPNGTTLPANFTFRDNEYRFIDAVYLATHILRFYKAFHYLPSTVDPKITSPEGLFPWSIPDGKQKFIGAIQNREGWDYWKNNEFYGASAMDYEMYALAKEIIQTETDVYQAGLLIYDWVHDLYNQTPYGLVFDVENLFGHLNNSYESIRNMQGTSGTPMLPKTGLYPAAGIPHGYDIRAYGGAVYVEGFSWFNAEVHAPYGSDINENNFFLFEEEGPLPHHPNAIALSDSHAVVKATAEIITLDAETTEMRAFWINPADVSNYGAETIVQTALDGDFNTIVLTVKTFVGRLYFDTGNGGDNIGYDALAQLLPAAQNAGIKLLAAFNTLSDYEMHKATEWGQRYLELLPFSNLPYNEFFISPCISEYRSYLRHLIQSLYLNYEIDGLVLARNYVIYDGWKNTQCNVSPNDIAQDTWLASFINNLAAYAKSLRPTREIYFLTAPLIGMNGDQNDDLTDDAAPDLLSAKHFDGIILTINGLSWLTNGFAYPLPAGEALVQSIVMYQQATTLPIHIVAHLSKEWQYPPEFYRGLARQYKSQGLRGVFLVSQNSAEGEVGSAFVQQHYGKLKNIKFLSSPPMLSDITGGILLENPSIPGEVSLHQNFPNPFNPSTTITFELPKSKFVELEIFDVIGQKITTLVSGKLNSGIHQISFKPDGLTSGIYFYRLTDGDLNLVKKMILIR